MDELSVERRTEIDNVLKETALKIKEGKVKSISLEEFVERGSLNDLTTRENKGK